MRVDTHHHFWNYSPAEYGWIADHMSALKRDFGVDDLQPLLAPLGIDAVVSVQARQSLTETQWLLDIAERNELVRGVVGWVPLRAETVREDIERWSHSPLLKAVRHVVHDEPDDEFILGREFNRGVAHLKDYGLVYDILIFAKHLPNTIAFVDQHPEQPFVLDHIAKPTIRDKLFDSDWETQIRELAKRENVVCKFSGVVTEVRDVDWTMQSIRPYWDVVLEAFGSKRLMFGSDWPVCLLRTDYARWFSTVNELSQDLSKDEQTDFWGENARRAYRL